jgi:hypothetical protein
MIRPEPSKKQWKAWDKEQAVIMEKLKECQKNNAGIMEITMKRALQIAEERKYK